MNVLVTGANGKLGKAVCNSLKNFNLIKFTHGNSVLQRTKNEYAGELAIKDHVDIVFEENEIDVVVHLAVSRNPMSNPRIRSFETLEKDNKILFNILSNCKKVKKFLFSSSASVYGFAHFKDEVAAKEVSDRFLECILEDSLNNTTVDISQHPHPTTNPDPLKHLDSSLADGRNDNRMLNGLSKYTNEMIIEAYASENSMSFVNFRIHRIV